MDSNYFIIHGSYGNSYKNWIPWLKNQLGKRKLNCVVPNFPPHTNKINSEKVIINDVGHFNEKYGYKEFRKLLKYL